MPETEPYLPESCLFHPSKREVRRPRPEFIHHGDFPEFCHPEQSSPLPFRPAFLRVGRARSRRICGFLCDHADSDGPQIPRLGPRSSSRQKQAGRGSAAGLAPSKIIHHGDTEDTELWFLPSLLRDLRASVVDLHPEGWAEGPYNTRDEQSNVCCHDE